MPKNLFVGDSEPPHGKIPAVGVLVVNLGSPAAPTAAALRPYLRQFLWDPRVIEMSRPLWWFILHAFVLTRRPRASARLYARVWTSEGSPLVVTSQRLTDRIEERLRSEVGEPLHCELGMTYGQPSVPAALARLKAKGCHRIVILPLYAHYSSTSTGAAFDAVMRELMTWRRVPEIRTIHQYHDDPDLIRLLADSVREHWARHPQGEQLVLSYHGIPKRYFLDGDPYFCQCQKTSRLLTEELDLPSDRFVTTFQSRFGKEEWLRPFTDEKVEELGKRGIAGLDIMCPGFAIDCLETLDEIRREVGEVYENAGGRDFRYIGCLNDGDGHVEVLAKILLRNLGGWTTPRSEWDAEEAAASARRTKELASQLQSESR